MHREDNEMRDKIFGIGFFVLTFGIMAADSDSMYVPLACLAGGLALMTVASKME